MCTVPGDSMPPLTDSGLVEKRKKFWEFEKACEAGVCLDRLSEEEKTIHACHKEAVLKGHFTYNDPQTQTKEWTRLRHFLRGACCGSACRHCIYEHAKVPDVKKRGKRFNSAFWVYDATDSASEPDEEMMFKLRKPKSRPQ